MYFQSLSIYRLRKNTKITRPGIDAAFSGSLTTVELAVVRYQLERVMAKMSLTGFSVRAAGPQVGALLGEDCKSFRT